MAAELAPTELVTPPLRLSFPHLFTPKAIGLDKPDELYYQAVLLIPPSVDLKPFYACVKAAMESRWSKVIKLSPRNMPIKDAAEANYDGYEEGWHFIRTKSKFPPSIVDKKREDVIDPERVYAGCWCRFHINTYAWDNPQGGKGVSFGLNAVMLVRDDARFDGRKSGAEAFAGVADVPDDAVPEMPKTARKTAAAVDDTDVDMDDLLG